MKHYLSFLFCVASIFPLQTFTMDTDHKQEEQTISEDLKNNSLENKKITRSTTLKTCFYSAVATGAGASFFYWMGSDITQPLIFARLVIDMATFAACTIAIKDLY